MKSRKILLLFMTLFMHLGLYADEGMWLLQLLGKNQSEMKKLGFKLTADDIYNINKASIKDAIVHFGGFCTGEIISGQGLVLTNHHCGEDAIQSHSTLEKDLLKNGFWAMKREEELANPDLFVRILYKIEDVTSKFNEKLKPEMTETERNDIITKLTNELTTNASENGKYEVQVKPIFSGNQFILFVFERYDDVRMVGAPPFSIGNFGGDTDNWMWPRHTGDFSLFRIYMNPDGKPAKYDPKNIPFKPKHFLPVSVKGVQEKDFAMIIGFPGTTKRFITSFGLNDEVILTNQNRIDVRTAKQKIWTEDMKNNDKVRIQYQTKYSRSSNYWKYSIGQNKGLRRLKVVERKQELENKFTKWVNENEDRKKKYGNSLTLIENGYNERKPYYNAFQYGFETMISGAEIFRFAYSNKGLINIVAKKTANEEEYKLKIADYKSEASAFFRDYNVSTDSKVTPLMLKMYADKVTQDFYPEFYNDIRTDFDFDFYAYTEKLFEKSIFADSVKFFEFLDNPNVEILKNDMALQAGMSIFKQRFELMGKRDSIDMYTKKGERLFAAGMLEMEKDKITYPDANSTIRLTYGNVGGYFPKDAVEFTYFTTLDGIMEKEDSTNKEFIVPLKMKELYNKKDFGVYGKNGVLNTCFIANLDITGGNSGSPVIGANGELIGLAFDGNWEAMSGDVVFEPELQRTICVDIRYVLFVIDKFAGASHLIKEMKIVQ